MEFNDLFTRHVVHTDSSTLNMALVVDSYNARFGGTAGNICYSLGLLEKPSIMISSVGKDFFQTQYPHILKEHLVDIRVDTYSNDVSARCFLVSDKRNNQIITFYAGALKYAHKINLFRKLSLYDNIKVAINAPNPVDAMVSFHNQLLKLKIPTIFDPGQQIGQFSRDLLKKILETVDFIILNEYEFELLQKRSGYSNMELISLIPTIIITLGEKGSILYDNGEKSEIPIVKPRKVVDPTGAGDGYRSGLLCGIVDDIDLYECCQLGAVVGSFIVETAGGQEHKFTKNDFINRYEQTFGSLPKRLKLF